MNRHKIETKIMSPLMGSSIPLPTYATAGSAAMDLRACLDAPMTVQPGETVLIPSGIAISIHDRSLVALLVPRSGLGIKHGIVLANSVGVIDSTTRGKLESVSSTGARRFTPWSPVSESARCCSYR